MPCAVYIMLAYMSACMHSRTHPSSTRAHAHTRTYTNEYTCLHIHTYIHTYIHTQGHLVLTGRVTTVSLRHFCMEFFHRDHLGQRGSDYGVCLLTKTVSLPNFIYMQIYMKTVFALNWICVCMHVCMYVCRTSPCTCVLVFCVLDIIYAF